MEVGGVGRGVNNVILPIFSPFQTPCIFSPKFTLTQVWDHGQRCECYKNETVTPEMSLQEDTNTS